MYNKMVANTLAGRNHGIDILRFLSMNMVCILHFTGHGKLIELSQEGSPQWLSLWLIRVFAYCAVDTFAIISGYVGYSEEKTGWQVAGFVKLWCQVVYYCLLICFLGLLANWNSFSVRKMINALTPISSEAYWYFTSYFIVFLIAPAINKIVSHSNSFQAALFIGIGFIVMYVCYRINGLYYPSLLLYMYFIGAVMKRCAIRGSNKKKLIIMLCITELFTWLWVVKLGGQFKAFSGFGSQIFLKYQSPTIILAAIILVLLFSEFKVTNKRIIQIIQFITPSVFSIYLLNDHELIRNNLIAVYIPRLLALPGITTAICVLFGAMIFSLSAILIDQIRIRIFKICKLEQIVIPKVMQNGKMIIESIVIKIYYLLLH